MTDKPTPVVRINRRIALRRREDSLIARAAKTRLLSRRLLITALVIVFVSILVSIGIGLRNTSEIRSGQRRTQTAAHQADAASKDSIKLSKLLINDQMRQTTNRLANVAVWCTAIDGIDSYIASVVSKAHIFDSLHILPCAELESSTNKSTKLPQSATGN
jgi:mannitol-specific phosphotransferase system IIBC component